MQKYFSSKQTIPTDRDNITETVVGMYGLLSQESNFNYFLSLRGWDSHST